jgi:hypothetical protein
MVMIVEQSVECELAGETEVHHKSHMTCPGFEPGPPRWEAGDYPPELWHGHCPQGNRCCSPVAMRLGRWADYSFASSVEIKSARSYTSINEHVAIMVRKQAQRQHYLSGRAV